MEHEWWSGNKRLTIKKDPSETDVLIMKLYQIKIEEPDSDNMGKVFMEYLKGIKLDYGGENLEKYGDTEKERYFNLVKKNYMGSYLIGVELSECMCGFVEELPLWKNRM